MVTAALRRRFKPFSISWSQNGLIRMRVQLPGGGCGPQCGTRRPEMAKFLKLIRNEKGATAIEYGLLAALIAVAAIAAMGAVGSKLGETFNNVAADLNTN